MTKALFINGSPRKNGNTAQLLKRAMEGAREAGAEVELVNLYDRSLNYKGCMSCFACKLKGGKKGVCSFKDDLQPILQKAVEADVLKRICSATIYTMNCPNEEVYRQMNYPILMDTSAKQLAVFGPTEILCSYDTYQFSNYDRYDAATFSEAHKAEVRDTQFPIDLEKAYELGKRLVIKVKDFSAKTKTLTIT